MSHDLSQPALAAEEGWTALEVPFIQELGPRYVSNDPDERRLRIRYFRRDTDGYLVGKAWFGPLTEGPPGHAHGGSVSALLDEAMGFAAWLQGHMVVAAQLTVNFREMLPLGTEALIEAWIEQVNGRKVTTRGRVHSKSGVDFADGQGLFLKLEPHHFNTLGAASS